MQEEFVDFLLREEFRLEDLGEEIEDQVEDRLEEVVVIFPLELCIGSII